MLCKSSDKKQLSLSGAAILSPASKKRRKVSRGLILPVSALCVKGRICLGEISVNHVPALPLVLFILQASECAWGYGGSVWLAVWLSGYGHCAVGFLVSLEVRFCILHALPLVLFIVQGAECAWGEGRSVSLAWRLRSSCCGFLESLSVRVCYLHQAS